MSWHARFGIVLAKPVDLQNRALAGLLGLQDGGAYGAAPGILGGNEQLLSASAECLAQRERHAAVLRHRADQRHGRLDRPALHDRTLEIARHGVAQPAQDLGGRVALLLRVDHVALGENRAAAGDARRATGGAHQAAHLFHANTACAAPAGPGTTRCPRRIRPNGRSPGCCRFPDVCTSSFRRRFRKSFGPGGRRSPIMRAMALNSFSKKRPSTLAIVRLPRARDADAFHAGLRHHLVKLLQQVVGGLNRTPGDAPVIGKDAAAGRRTHGGGIRDRRAQRLEDRTVPGFPQGGQLETDRPDVQADIDAHFTSSLTLHSRVYKQIRP